RSDGISIDALKPISDILIPIIIDILNYSLTTASFSLNGKKSLSLLYPKFNLPHNQKILDLFLYFHSYLKSLNELYIPS
ncbi:MAG: hypothetical protein QOK58_11820, partial [Nitrososphaeraceae archaeon]|nr:hypothetical protein [Nitrososphaeraceae archaeon]